MKNFKSGKATVTIQEDMQDMFMGFLKTVAPGAEAIMDAELKRIEKEARLNWPKRKPIIRRDRDGTIVKTEKTTLESYKKFKRGIKIGAGGKLIVFLKNTCPIQLHD